jgi:hypothetical protein
MARHIEVLREPRNGSIRVYIDGELFPYFLTGDGIKVEPRFGEPGEVTLTLVAEHITVDDRYLLGAAELVGLDHDHAADEQPDAVFVDAVPPCTRTPNCPLDAGHPGPCL